MNVTSPLECPACKAKTQVSFKKPGLFSPVIFDYDCEGCASQVKVKIRKLPKTPPTQVNITVLGVTPSQMVIDMLREEAAPNSKSVEEQGA